MHPPSLPSNEQRRTRFRGSERGISLVELAVGLTVIALATMGSVSWTLSSMNLDTQNREEAAANEVMRGIVEELQNLPFEQLWARFNTNPEDDPDGPGTARGSMFEFASDRDGSFLTVTGQSVKSVKSVKGTKDAALAHKIILRVELKFPVDENGRLSEQPVDATGSLPAWDLDGDGELSDRDQSQRYRMLPVRVRVTWQSARGNRSLEFVRLLTRRERPSDV